MKMKWILVFAVCVFVSAGVSAQVKQVPQSRQQVQLSYAPLVKKVSAAVVNIYTTKSPVRGAHCRCLMIRFLSDFSAKI